MREELAKEIAAKRERIATLRHELEAERNKLTALEEFATKLGLDTPPLEKKRERMIRLSDPVTDKRRAPPVRERIHDPVDTVPLKVLIMKALLEQFPQGTTANNLLQWIQTEWGRRSSMNAFNVELSVLKQAGEVYFENRLWGAVDKGEEE